MKKLSNSEMKNIYGGGISIGGVAITYSIVSFIVGLFDGITRPFKCR